MSSRQIINFPIISKIGSTARLVIQSLVTGRYHQISFSQLAEQLPYEKKELFSPLLNKTISTETVKDALDLLLFPFVAPSITSMSINIANQEVGSTVAAGSYTLSFVVSNPENVNGSLTLSNSDLGTISTNINASATSFTFSIGAITKTIKTNSVFTLSGTNKEGNSFSRTFTVTWRFPRLAFVLGSGDGVGEGVLLAGTRQLGDTRDPALDVTEMSVTLNTLITDGDIPPSAIDLNSNSFYELKSYPAPEAIGANGDYRIYFIYHSEEYNGSIMSSFSEVSTLKVPFQWTRNGVTEDYNLFTIDTDYRGSSTPLLGTSEV